MNERDLTRLRNMLDAAQKVQSYIDNKTRQSLDTDDELLGYAVVRAIEIVGEAASKITPETRAEYPQIEWQNIIGMRNRIVHDYLRVDYDIVWQVVTVNLPELVDQLETILA
jgi:uncharacterized protein with HEPN domain